MAISPHHPTALVPNPVHAFDFLFKVALERRVSWICRQELARVCWRGVLPMWLAWSECQCWIAQNSTAIVKTRPAPPRVHLLVARRTLPAIEGAGRACLFGSLSRFGWCFGFCKLATGCVGHIDHGAAEFQRRQVAAALSTHGTLAFDG